MLKQWPKSITNKQWDQYINERNAADKKAINYFHLFSGDCQFSWVFFETQRVRDPVLHYFKKEDIFRAVDIWSSEHWVLHCESFSKKPANYCIYTGEQRKIKFYLYYGKSVS